MTLNKECGSAVSMQPKTPPASRRRNLVIVLGDQLTRRSAAFDGFDLKLDAVMMAESSEEAEHVPQHRQRLVLFLSAMRHFEATLRAEGICVDYTAMEASGHSSSLAGELIRRAKERQPEKLIVVQPGDYRVLSSLKAAACSLELPLEVRPDRHFIDSIDEFSRYAGQRKTLRLEPYYRARRKNLGLLVDKGRPIGGRWNYDADNRSTLPKRNRVDIPPPLRFQPDRITQDVMSLVRARFPGNPGQLEGFAHPVSADDAARVLDDFVTHRLLHFGQYQDAMAVGKPHLFHSLLSTSLNLHLLDPRDVINAALAAWRDSGAPLSSVEGFVRQVLGWREFIRGVYWWRMPEYADSNALGASLPLPEFMWTAETSMNCVRQCVVQLKTHGYTHHIQRLMVLGLFAMLLGVNPREVNRWHMAMSIDAVDWVSAPNVLGMSQYADGGIVASKPYCASGSYINKMSDYCRGCRYDPARAHGDESCPFTVLYWDFLDRHSARLAGNARMRLQLRNLDRKPASEIRAIRAQADVIKADAGKRSPG